MEKSARRISSIFSLGSTSSDKSNSKSNRPPSIHTPHDSRTPSPSKLHPTHTSTLQPSASSPNLRTPRSGESPRLDPSFDPIYPASAIRGHDLPPGVYKPLPLPPGSFRGARPHSAASSRPSSPPKNFSRPSSSNGSRPASPSKAFLRPMTSTSERGRPSRPASMVSLTATSRPISPTKHLSRPATPISERQTSKRRSWLPGRSKHESAEASGEAQAPPLAWALVPEQQIPYDVSPLLNFQKVSNATTIIHGSRMLTALFRSRNSGMNAGTPSSTFTRRRLRKAHLFGLTQVTLLHLGN